MLFHYLALVLVFRVKEGRFLRKTPMSLKEIEEAFHLKLFAIKAFVDFAKLVQNIFGFKIITLRSDHGAEFDNHQFQKICTENGIVHNLSCPRTSQ